MRILFFPSIWKRSPGNVANIGVKKDNFYVAIMFNFLLFMKLVLPEALRRRESLIERLRFKLYELKYIAITLRIYIRTHT